MLSFKTLFLPLVLAAGVASAQTYPDKSKAIRFVVPYNAGTSADILSRAVARGMTDAGLNVVIDNKAGAEAVIGMQAAKTAAPDGYTIVLITTSTQALNPHMFNSLPYDPIADFVPIAGVAKVTLMLNLGPSTPFKSAREFIAAARANPGKYTIGSASTTTRLAGEMLQRAAGIKLLSVSYKSFSDAMSNLASGQLDMVIVDTGTAAPFYKSNVRPVASTGSTRLATYPDVPTLKEEGVSDYEVAGWFAVAFPAKTPPAIVSALQDILRTAVKSKYVTDTHGTFSMEQLPLFGSELDAFQRAELDKWGKAVRSANLPKL